MHVHQLQRTATAACHAGQRVVGHLHVQAGLLADQAVDVAQLTIAIDAKASALADRRWSISHVAEGYALIDAERITLTRTGFLAALAPLAAA